MSTGTRVGVHGHVCTPLHRGRAVCVHKCASTHKSALRCTDLHQGRKVCMYKHASAHKSALRFVCARALTYRCARFHARLHTQSFARGKLRRGRAAWGVRGCDFWSGQGHLCSHSEQFLTAMGWRGCFNTGKVWSLLWGRSALLYPSPFLSLLLLSFPHLASPLRAQRPHSPLWPQLRSPSRTQGAHTSEPFLAFPVHPWGEKSLGVPLEHRPSLRLAQSWGMPAGLR